MKTYEKHIDFPDKYYEIFNCIDKSVVMYQNPSIVDFGTAMANKRRNKRNKRK